MPNADAKREILALERSALDRWCQGDPLGYPEIYADDVTYFDDIGAQERVDGIDEARAYMSSLRGEIPPHRYELVDPRVQLMGDAAVLTLRYVTRSADGTPLTPWKATSVYRRGDDGWRIVHAHWSVVKDA